MRTDAEITEAIRIVNNVVEFEERNGLRSRVSSVMYCALDLLHWARGDKGTKFEQDVMEPTRIIDRAERQ